MILRNGLSDITLETRNTDNEHLVTLSGYAVKWGDISRRGDFIYETIEKGAFPKEARANVKYLTQHRSLPLASTRSGTLHIEENEIGLLVEPTVDTRDTDSANLVRKVERGDLDGQSIGFSRYGNSIETTERDDNTLLITIRKVKRLAEVSAVAVPAYDSSTLSAREYEFIKDVEDFTKAKDMPTKERLSFLDNQYRLSLLLKG